MWRVVIEKGVYNNVLQNQNSVSANRYRIFALYKTSGRYTGQTDRQIHYVDTAFLSKKAGHTYRLVRNERVQVPLRKVVNSHSRIRGEENIVISINQCTKSVTIAPLNMFMINMSVTKLDKVGFL